MTGPIRGSRPRGIDRRTAITALGTAPVLAIQPGCAAPIESDSGLNTVRRLLQAISDGRFAAYLDGFGAERPMVGGFEDDRGVSLLPCLKGISLAVTPGAYLVRAAQRCIEVVLPAAEAPTAGRIGAARFFFIESKGQLRLRSAMFGPLAEDRLYRLAGTGLAATASAQQVQAAYDALEAAGGGTLFFPAGIYRISLVLTSRRVRLAGAGMDATILKPAASDRPVIEGAYNSGSWSTVEIADLAIVGDGAGDGFRAGRVPRQPQDEFIGRTRFRNVRFADLTICINRPYGQIGLWLENCIFQGADYHLHSIGTLTPGEAMHSGNLLAQNCHFSGARKAVFLLKSGVTGTGQITFDRCIMEVNEGFVFYIDTMNGADGVPGMLVRSCWNEVNASAASVTIDRPGKPIYGYFKDASLIRFEDTPLGDLELTNTTVATIDCSLDRLGFVSTDKASTLVHRHARGFGSFAPKGLVESVAASYQFGPNRALSFIMPVPRRHIGLASQRGILLASEPGPAIASAHIDLAPGERRRLLSPSVVPQGRWIVWICECRRVSGSPVTMGIAGSAGISTPFPVEHDVLRSVAGLSWCEAAVRDVQVELVASGPAHSIVETKRIQLVSFERRQDALDYLNSNTFLIR